MDLKCDMEKECVSEVTHIGGKGWVYCTKHGEQRKAYGRCRKLRPWEKKRLERGDTIKY